MGIDENAKDRVTYFTLFPRIFHEKTDLDL